MDPAEASTLKEVLQLQGAAIGRHEELLQRMMQQLSILVSSHTEAASETSAPQPPPPDPPTPQECSLFFEQQPSRFPTECSKVAFIISLLTGKALAWATAMWEQASPDCTSSNSFTAALRQTFYQPPGGWGTSSLH
uniref:DUF4939 domain-containing protein n=1 Tax=Astyanax mexicanus TaxID=7994 RepID=A0A3B1K2Y4_ASTMX